jgi:hypothetical protein
MNTLFLVKDLTPRGTEQLESDAEIHLEKNHVCSWVQDEQLHPDDLSKMKKEMLSGKWQL